MSAPKSDGPPDPYADLDAYQRAEAPLHRPRPCPACRRESRAIIEGKCLRCRTEAGS